MMWVLFIQKPDTARIYSIVNNWMNWSLLTSQTDFIPKNFFYYLQVIVKQNGNDNVIII